MGTIMADLLTLENLGNLIMLCFLQAVLDLTIFSIFQSKAKELLWRCKSPFAFGALLSRLRFE